MTGKNKPESCTSWFIIMLFKVILELNLKKKIANDKCETNKNIYLKILSKPHLTNDGSYAWYSLSDLKKAIVRSITIISTKSNLLRMAQTSRNEKREKTTPKNRY